MRELKRKIIEIIREHEIKDRLVRIIATDTSLLGFSNCRYQNLEVLGFVPIHAHVFTG